MSNQQKTELIKLITNIINLITQKETEVSDEKLYFDDELSMLDEINESLRNFKKIIEDNDLTISYANQFNSNLVELFGISFDFVNLVRNSVYASNLDEAELKIRNKMREERNIGIQKSFNKFKFNLNFFDHLNYLKTNIVAVGANGSGKTELANHLKDTISEGIIISAQKIIIIPTFNNISNIDTTNQKLMENQRARKTSKTTYSNEHERSYDNSTYDLLNEFLILFNNLIASRIANRNEFCDEYNKNSTHPSKVPESTLDKVLLIWNSLIKHKIIEIEKDGMTLSLHDKKNKNNHYPAYRMSDGEKVILYLAAQVLLAPENGIIIIDEPEMYLHKTILNKLWNTLEHKRRDCKFIYLTHDLDFATNRINAKKIWIRSFTYPDQITMDSVPTWEIEQVPETDLPETLLLELLGSRKKILFCEGKTNSTDNKIYNILFPEYTITPVESCFSVINYTKAFNNIKNKTVEAFGIIDSDHHSKERLDSLKKENIFSFGMAEVENLFFDENFFKSLADNLCLTSDSNEVIKKLKSDIIERFKQNIEVQISNYVSTEIDFYFKNSHPSKGNTLIEIEKNYKKFSEGIKIDEMFKNRKEYLEKLIKNNDYTKIISIVNNKGIVANANENLQIKDFQDRALIFLQRNKEAHDFLLKYFPEELRNQKSI